jgi:predicted RNase H-like HicB family nuclease
LKTVPAYTAFLFAQADGSYVARVPALPECAANGVTRAQALENAAKAASATLRDHDVNNRSSAPKEDWSPSRTIRVQNPRTKALVPYAVMVSANADAAGFCAVAVLFPEVEVTAESIDQALIILSPRIFQHLTELVARNRDFPVQDDQSAYVIDVPIPDPPGSGDAYSGGPTRP